MMWRKQKRLLAEQDRKAIEGGGKEDDEDLREGQLVDGILAGLPEQKKETLAVKEVEAGGVV